MKQTLYSWRKQLVGLLLVALVAGPLASNAQTIAEQIASLRSQLNTLTTIIATSPSLTPSEVATLNASIANVNTAITNLEAAALNVVTMEVIIDPAAGYAEAQFLDATDSVMYLDFYFATNPTTTQDWFDAIVDRTAITLGLSSTTDPSPASLSANIVQVPAFSGPSVFFPAATTTAPTGPSTFTPTAMAPTIPTPYRNNVEKVELRGSAKDYRVTAHIYFGPETTATTTLPAASTTYMFDFSASTTAADNDYMMRLMELENFAIDTLARNTGYARDYLMNLSETSFSTFDNASDVQFNRIPRAQGEGLVNMFGSYSIINDIEVVAGEGRFAMILRSDQDETLALRLTEEDSYGENSGGWNNGNGDWDYSLTYSIHGVTVDSDTDSDYDAPGVRNYFLVNDLLEGIGDYMGTASTSTLTPDERFVGELVAFMMGHSVYYETDSYYSFFGGGAETAARACHDNRAEDIIERVLAFYLDEGLQYARTIPEITNLRAPINYVDDDEGWFWSSQCRSVNNSFFPSQP